MTVVTREYDHQQDTATTSQELAMAEMHLSPAERARRGSMSKWEMRADGTYAPPPLQDKFLEEWCLVPPNQRMSQMEWGELHGVSTRTISGWKKNPKFRDEWNRRMGDTWLDPDNVGPIIRNLMNMATSQGPQAVKAAETYLKFVGMMQPPDVNVNVRVPQDLSRLDDAELIAMLETETLELERADDGDE